MYDVILREESPKKRMIDFVRSQFVFWDIPCPQEETLQTLLAHTWDWLSHFHGYILEVLGIEEIQLKGQVVNFDYVDHWLREYTSKYSDMDGEGLILYKRFKEFNYHERLNSGPKLNPIEKDLLTKWNQEHPISFSNPSFMSEENNWRDKQITLATWALITWLVSEEGMKDLEFLDYRLVWIEDIVWSTHNWVQDRNKFIYSQKQNQINGAAIVLDIGLTYGWDYDALPFLEEFYDEETANKIRNTGAEVICPGWITLHDRTIKQCGNCLRELDCVDYYRYTNLNECIEEERLFCRYCAGFKYDDLEFLGDMSLKSPLYGCLGAMLKYITENGLSRDLSISILKNAIKYNYRTMCDEFGLIIDDPYDLDKILEERNVSDVSLRLMIGALLKKNECYTMGYGRSCPLIDFELTMSWFMTIDTEGLIRRMELGSYTPRRSLT